MELALPDKREGGRPNRRFMDVVTVDMLAVGVTVEGAENRTKWKWMMYCGDPHQEQSIKGDILV